MIRQFADGGEPVFQRMLPWAADLERSGNEAAGLPDEFWQGPGRAADELGPAESVAMASEGQGAGVDDAPHDQGGAEAQDAWEGCEPFVVELLVGR
jgi:hypothetical protein